jgi:hypothetical protein
MRNSAAQPHNSGQGTQLISCACGATRFVCTGKPIIVAECYCDSCRKAATVLEALPGAPAVQESTCGTQYVLHRKDRVAPVSGTEYLRELRLAPASGTRRIVATCCNSPMFLDFAQGHWFSVYARRFPPDAAPAIEERTMLRDMPKGFAPPPDARNSGRQSPRFFVRLFAAWAAMGFRTPRRDWGHASLGDGPPHDGPG